SPCAENSRWSRCRTGISGRHSAHQLAQKFTRTTLPRRAPRESRLPSSVWPSKRGGAVPWRYSTSFRALTCGASFCGSATTDPQKTSRSTDALARRRTSALRNDFPDIPQDAVAVDDRRDRVLDHPFLSDDALRIDQEKRAVRDHQFLVENAVGPHGLALREIAEQRERQAERFGEGLLGKAQVGAGGEVLHAQGLEALVVGFSRRQVRCARRREVGAVELEQHPLLAVK